ncbi:MAG: ATP-binding protein [Spirochaetes bacterium]|nr:ATP-binding protein [Spirochaetota bacterium]
MLIFNKEKIKNLFNYLKDKKILIIILLFSFFISIIFMINYFNLLKLQQNVLKSEIDFNYKSLLISKYNQIISIINNVNKIIALSFYHTYYDNFIINELSKLDFIDSVIILNNYSKLLQNINEYYQKEKELIEFEKYILGQKAYENNLYELSISYFLNLINSEKDIIYIKIKSYYYLAKIYFELGNNENAIKFSYLGIKYILMKNVYDEVILSLYTILFDVFYDFNLKKNFAINIIFIKNYFNVSDDLVKSEVLSFYNRYCKKENELILSDLNANLRNNIFSIRDYFLNYYQMIKDNNILFVKKNKSYIGENFVLIIVNFKLLLNNENKNHNFFYFNLQVENDYFLENRDGFSEFDKVSLPFYKENNPIFLNLFIEKSKMVNFIAKKQFFFGFILIIMLFFTGIFSFSVIFLFFLKEYELNIMKSEFISIVSHELKTPITTIQLVTDSILRNYDKISEEKKMGYMNKIKNESQRLLYLINNLLTFTKNEKNKKYIILKEVDFILIIDEVVELFKISKKNVNFILDFSFKNMIILGDEDLLKQVVYNILDNSYKYSGEEKIIQINIYEKSNQYVCEFIDNGIGIDEDDLKKVFEKFYRGKNTLNIPGTGLGLSLIKYIIEYHGGKVLIESKKGVGTKVTLIFNKIQKNLDEEALHGK